jgi:hypothetical protein
MKEFANKALAEDGSCRATREHTRSKQWSFICTLVPDLATLTAQRGPSFD